MLAIFPVLPLWRCLGPFDAEIPARPFFVVVTVLQILYPSLNLKVVGRITMVTMEVQIFSPGLFLLLRRHRLLVANLKQNSLSNVLADLLWSYSRIRQIPWQGAAFRFNSLQHQIQRDRECFKHIRVAVPRWSLLHWQNAALELIR